MEPNLDALRGVLTDWAVPPADMVSTLDRGRGVRLDYVGHADVTRILLDIDPTWTLEPAAVDAETGGPVIRPDGAGNLQAWFRLTMCGVTRLCVGTCPDNKREPAKELIGDALRNGAMRFGVALSLWAKHQWDDEPVVDRGTGEVKAPAKKAAKKAAAKAAAPKAAAPKVVGQGDEPAGDPKLRGELRAGLERAKALGLADAVLVAADDLGVDREFLRPVNHGSLSDAELSALVKAVERVNAAGAPFD